MGAVRVTDPRRMRLILETFASLDEIRWADRANYDATNYCARDLTPDEKLLTHLLCYITDRQTDYRRIWDVGAYVVSYLVREFSRGGRGTARELLGSVTDLSPTSETVGLGLVVPSDPANAVLARYGLAKDAVRFSSRYMATDLVYFLRTLHLLDVLAERSLGKFLAMVLDGASDHRQGLRRMAAALDGLTYAAGGQVATAELSAAMDKALLDAEEEADRFRRAYASGEMTRWRSVPPAAGRKRLWCTLRDWLKHIDLNAELVRALRGAGVKGAKGLSRRRADLRAALDVLELPGDVWNDRMLRQGLFEPYAEGLRGSGGSAKAVRAVYEDLVAEGPISFYPEQLDVSFDFARLMCQNGRCRFCLFNVGVGKLCHATAGLLCPVAMTSCDYTHTCDPDACRPKADMVRGFCTGAI